jgi:hypothetical protein
MTALPFTIAADPRQCSHLGYESRGTHDHTLLYEIRDSPNLEGQIPVFISQELAPAWTAQKASLPLLRVLSLPGKQHVHRAVP